jgi:hypothetical protein
MKAFLIDPQQKLVSTVDYDGDYKNIQKMIEAEYFTTVTVNSAQDALFVDDMGLYTKKSSFMVANYASPLKGKALLLGVDGEGDSVSPTLTYEEVVKMIKWEIG